MRKMLQSILQLALYVSLSVSGQGDANGQKIGNDDMDMSQHMTKQQPPHDSDVPVHQTDSKSNAVDYEKYLQPAKQNSADYQKYISQYSKDSKKSVDDARSSQKASGQHGQKSGTDYQSYMKKVFEDDKKFTGSYTKQHAGDYQKFMDMKLYDEDYQKFKGQSGQGGTGSYMKQYAGDYQKFLGQSGQVGSGPISLSVSGQGDANAQKIGMTKQQPSHDSDVPDHQTDSQSSGQGGTDYQKYMTQYAGDYQKFMGQGGQGGAGGYKQYMAEYAAAYKNYMPQGGQGANGQGGAGGAGGAGVYQSYIKDFMLNVKNKSDKSEWQKAAKNKYTGGGAAGGAGGYQSYYKNFVANVKNKSDSNEWSKVYRNKFASNYMPHIKNKSNSDDVRKAFANKYAGDFAHSSQGSKDAAKHAQQKAAPSPQSSKDAAKHAQQKATNKTNQDIGFDKLDAELAKTNQDLAKMQVVDSATDQASKSEAATSLSSADSSRSFAQAGGRRTLFVVVSAMLVGAGIVSFVSVNKRRVTPKSDLLDALSPPEDDQIETLQPSYLPPSDYLLLTEP